MAPHSSTLAWKTPWMEEPGGLQSMGLLRVGHDGATSLSLFTSIHWRRKWQPTPVFLLENPRDRGAWWAAVYGVSQSRTRLKRLSSSSTFMWCKYNEGAGSKLWCVHVFCLVLLGEGRLLGAGWKAERLIKQILISDCEKCVGHKGKSLFGISGVYWRAFREHRHLLISWVCIYASQPRSRTCAHECVCRHMCISMYVGNTDSDSF